MTISTIDILFFAYNTVLATSEILLVKDFIKLGFGKTVETCATLLAIALHSVIIFKIFNPEIPAIIKTMTSVPINILLFVYWYYLCSKTFTAFSALYRRRVMIRKVTGVR